MYSLREHFETTLEEDKNWTKEKVCSFYLKHLEQILKKEYFSNLTSVRTYFNDSHYEKLDKGDYPVTQWYVTRKDILIFVFDDEIERIYSSRTVYHVDSLEIEFNNFKILGNRQPDELDNKLLKELNI